MKIGLSINNPHIFLFDEPSAHPPSEAERAKTDGLIIDLKLSNFIKEILRSVRSRNVTPVGHLVDSRSRDIPLVGHLFSSTGKKSITKAEICFIKNKPSQLPSDLCEELSADWEKVSEAGSETNSESSWEKV